VRMNPENMRPSIIIPTTRKRIRAVAMRSYLIRQRIMSTLDLKLPQPEAV